MARTLIARQPKKLSPRVDPNPEEGRRFTHTHGHRAMLAMAHRCPCGQPLTLDSHAARARGPDADCEACQGTGLLYDDEQQIVATVDKGTRSALERWTLLYGALARGMATITVLPEHTPPVMSKLRLPDAWHVISERFTRRDTVEAPTWPIRLRTLDLGDPGDATVSAPETFGTLGVYVANAAGVYVDTPLVEGTDYEVTDAGALDWTLGDAAGTAPAVGARYAVTYYANPVYVVQGYPAAHRNTYRKVKSPVATLAELPVEADAVLEVVLREVRA